MKHIFYADFDNLLGEYKEVTSKEDKLIKHRLDSIIALYDAKVFIFSLSSNYRRLNFDLRTAKAVR